MISKRRNLIISVSVKDQNRNEIKKKIKVKSIEMNCDSS